MKKVIDITGKALKRNPSGYFSPLCLGILLVCTLAARQANATTYYVSLSGDDNWSGTTPENAWRHIAYSTEQVQAGDSVIVLSGDYGDEQAVMANTGTPELPIVIMAQEPGEVILTGNGDGIGFSMINRHHILVDGFEFDNYQTGLLIKYQSTNITIKRCVFKENQVYGLLLYGLITDPSLSHSHTFTENEFYDYSGTQDYGIALYFSTYVIAANNYFFGRHNQALSFKKLMFNSIAENNIFDGFYYTAIYLGQNEDDPGGQGVLRSHNLIAEANVFRPAIGFRAKRSIMVRNVTRAVVRSNFTEGLPEVDGGWGEGIGVHTSSINAKIYRNVMRTIGGTTTNPGIRFYGLAEGTKVFHNTITDCAYNLGFEELASAEFKNNVFNGCYHGMIREGNADNCVFEYNDIYPLWSGAGSTDISQDPLFTGPFTPLVMQSENPRFVPDFSRAYVCQLQGDSPCIDAAAYLTQTVGSGNGTEITVEDSEYFTDGFGVAEGDMIHVGANSPVRITSLDYDNNTVTVEMSISWNDGDGVSQSCSGSTPDIGAYEYGFTGIEEREEINNVFDPFILRLWQNSPNPFSQITAIGYSIPGAGQVELSIYNLAGRKVATLASGYQSEGYYEYQWDAGDLVGGIYFIRLVSSESIATRKILLFK